MKSKKIIFCDLGNVLVFFDMFKCVYRYLALGKRPAGEVLPELFENGFFTDLDIGQCTNREFYEKACRVFKMRLDFEIFCDIWNDIFDENILLTRWIEELSQKYRVFLISNTNALHYDFLRRRHHFFRFISGTVASHEAGLRKPDPRIFYRALNMAGATASNAFFLDDMQVNVNAALQCGLHARRYVDVSTAMRDFQLFLRKD